MRWLLYINMRIRNNAVPIKILFGFFLSLFLAPTWVNAQSIELQTIGENYVSVTVRGVAPYEYKLAIVVEEFGRLWTKPNLPTIPISNVPFNYQFYTAEQDFSPRKIHIFLLPIDAEVPTVAGDRQIPKALVEMAVDVVTITQKGVPEPLRAIDRILEGLEFGNIAFNTPRSINLHDTAIIQLMLGLSAPIDELIRLIKAEGEKEGARIRISDRMEARLSGPNFAITAITPEKQAVSGSNVTEWKWEVKPNSGGSQHLHLTLSVLLSVNGLSTPRAIRSFDKMIDIKVPLLQRVGTFLEENWQWLWATVLVPMAGWIWKRKREEKASKSKVSQFDR